MNADEQQVYNLTLAPKIYKTKAIQVGTFLGGPLVAGYLIAENFKAFNESDKVKRTWIYSCLATILIFAAVFLIPDNVKIPNIAFPLIYSWITYYIVQHYQGTQIATHNNAGSETFNWWRVIGIGLIGTVVTVALLFIVGYFVVS